VAIQLRQAVDGGTHLADQHLGARHGLLDLGRSRADRGEDGMRA
jgi:hypothetical protein